MASHLGNIRTKNYQNLITGFQVTVKNVGDAQCSTGSTTDLVRHRCLWWACLSQCPRVVSDCWDCLKLQRCHVCWHRLISLQGHVPLYCVVTLAYLQTCHRHYYWCNHYNNQQQLQRQLATTTTTTTTTTNVVTVSHWPRSVKFDRALRKKNCGFGRFQLFDHHQNQLLTSSDNAHARC